MAVSSLGDGLEAVADGSIDGEGRNAPVYKVAVLVWALSPGKSSAPHTVQRTWNRLKNVIEIPGLRNPHESYAWFYNAHSRPCVLLFRIPSTGMPNRVTALFC